MSLVSAVPVTLQELRQTSERVRVFRVGTSTRGRLESVGHLEQALQRIRTGRLPVVGVLGYWFLRSYIEPYGGSPVEVARIGSHRVFTRSALRRAGQDLVLSVIRSIELGGLQFGTVGSDVHSLSLYDLATLQHAEQEGEAEGFYTLHCVIYQ
jgi:hypothetical protein